MVDAVIFWTVPPEEEGIRIDSALPSHVEDATRTQAKRWIEDGRVKVGSRPVRPSRLLHAGEQVEVVVPAVVPAVPPPEAIPLSLAYEDEHLLVVDKPAGMVVHAGAGHRSGTLVNALLYHCSHLSGIGGVSRPGIVHRLDRGTSGLLVVAKSDRVHRALARQFAARGVEKEYLALVHGRPPAKLRIDTAIGRDRKDRKKISSRSDRARTAVTEIERIETLNGTTLVGVKIETGRTHQIRVHLAEAGYPVVGDLLYGRGREARTPPPAKRILGALSRPALHARLLGFEHPVTRQFMRFESKLPPELEAVIAELRALER